MKTKRTEILVIILFILTILGLMLTIYYLAFAEKTNFPVLLGSSIINILIMIFFIRYLLKAKKSN